MQVLEIPFKFLKFYGVWKPENLSKFWNIFYKIYTCLILFLMHLYFLSYTYDLIFSKNDEKFGFDFYINFAMFTICLRIIFLLINRKRIVELSRILSTNICIPQNLEEFDIQEDCNILIR